MKNYRKDFYEVLGISFKASPKEIRDAYHKAARRYHPDKTNGDKAATARFLVIQEGYEVLTDPKQRKHYDTRCYPIIQRTRSCATKRAREQSSEADGEAPSRSKPPSKKPCRKDAGSAWYDEFDFEEAFIETLVERERQFMHDWDENQSRRAHSLMKTAQDIEIMFADIQQCLEVANVSNRERVQQTQAGIDDGLGKEPCKVWSAGFSAHLDELLQTVWRNEHPVTGLATTLCSRIINRQPYQFDMRTMVGDAQRLETLMPQVLRAWRRTARTQKRINVELQMLDK